MQTLSSYTEADQTNLFKQLGAFFAFSQSQFDEKRKEGVEYISLSCGMIVPKDNAKALVTGLSEINAKGVAQDLAENGREAIIRRELHNYECFYVGSVTDAAEALQAYDISLDEVKAVYRAMLASGEVQF